MPLFMSFPRLLSLREKRSNLSAAISSYPHVIAVSRRPEWSEGAAKQSKGVQRDFPLVGVWGCPPALQVPQDWGTRGLIETISAFSNSTSQGGRMGKSGIASLYSTDSHNTLTVRCLNVPDYYRDLVQIDR
jgi:hypothetical protein